ncbi:hypothetical protein [Embleya sp. NPDC001921]
MIRLITRRRLHGLLAERARHIQHVFDRTLEVEQLRNGARRLAERAAAADTLAAERDQARAIAVDLEQQLAAAANGDTTRELREQRDQALALAEISRAAAEAADIPIVDGLTVDDYVAMRRAIYDAVAPRKPSDNRRRIYIDGHGLAWIDSCQDPDGTQYIGGIDSSPGREEAAEKVRARTGALRVIGATK